MGYCPNTLRMAIAVCDAELEEMQKLARARAVRNPDGAHDAEERSMAIHDIRSKFQRALYETQEADLARARESCALQDLLLSGLAQRVG